MNAEVVRLAPRHAVFVVGDTGGTWTVLRRSQGWMFADSGAAMREAEALARDDGLRVLVQ